MLATCLFALIMAASNAAAPLPPTPRFRHYTIADGLPSNNVYSTIQDTRGYIWVGTNDGLARFDGRHFTIFRHRSGDPASLPTNDVSVLLVDQRGRLWAGGEGSGLNRYEPATGGFRHWLHHAGDPGSLSGDDLMGLAQTSDGAIWAGVYAGGVDRLSDDGSHFTTLRHRDGDPGSLASDNIATLHADSEGRLWIGSDRGVDMRDADGRIHHIHFAGVSQASFWAWQIDGDGDDVRVATNLGLFTIGADLVARRLPRLAQVHDNVYSSFRTTRGGLWVGLRGGMRLLTSDGRSFSFPTRRLLPGGLPGRLIMHVMRDREGGLWLSSLDAGLLYLSPHWRDFTAFGHIPEDPDSLQDSRVLALAREPDGNLLVGGPNGALDRLDPRTGAVEHLDEAMGLPEKSVTGLLAGRDGRIWIGQERGLRVLDAHGELRRVGEGVLHNGVVWMAHAADGGVYVAPSSQGVFHVDPQTLAMTPLALAAGGEKGRETHALVLRGKVLWRGSRSGLSWLLPGATRLHHVPGVTRGPVDALAFDGSGFWLARPDALEHYRLAAGKAALVRRVDAGDGLPAVGINGLFVDGGGRVWLTSQTGLWRFDPTSGGFRRYGTEDGLPSPGFGHGVIADQGRVYAATLGGVVAFRPLSLHDRPQPPLLRLTSAEVRRSGKQRVLPLASGEIAMGWRDRDLHVVAQALSYIDPQRIHYRFRMVGLDSGWVDTGTHGEREFAALPPGDYALQVEAAGPDGAWATLPRAWPVRVAAPPWERPWAWLAYALAGLALGWLAWRVARRRVEQRVHLNMLEQASAAKTRFLATLGHEIRTPMTGVLGMAELLTHTPLDARQRGFVGAIERSGSVLLKLVNDALDMARIEAGRLPLEIAPFDPAALLHEVAALEDGLAAAKQLRIEVQVAADVPRWVNGDAVRVKQILLNLTANAVKFTEAGRIGLCLVSRDGALVYAVRDSGPGLAEADRHRLFRRFEQGSRNSGSGGSGLGLAICRELAALMGGSVEVESLPGAGSTFSVTLPLPAAASGPSAKPPPQAPHARRILLVEDDPVVGEVIGGLLEAQGHEVRHAADALAAISELAVAHCDAALVDLDLPDIDGFELIRMLRANVRRALLIIVVTARTEAGDETEAREAGADGFLRKPVSGDQLAAALAAAGEPASAAAAPGRAGAAAEPPPPQTTDDA